MSFGWSAGDITRTIIIIAKIVTALDSAEGAAADYREAVTFLESLKRTLEPLQTYTHLGACPSYGHEIQQLVEKVKVPVENFLAVVTKFEPTLGSNAKAGHYRSIGRKLQWRFITSKTVVELRNEIGGYLAMLDHLLNRLILETVVTILKNSSGELRAAFTDVLHPQLIALLKDNLAPIQDELEKGQKTQYQHHEAIIREIQRQHANMEPFHMKWSARQRILDQQYETIITKIREQEVNLRAAIDAVNQHITNMAPSLKTEKSSQNYPSIYPSWYSNPFEQCDDLSKLSCKQRLAPEESLVKRVSLKELYYLVFLYLGQFLQRLCQMASRKTRFIPIFMPESLCGIPGAPRGSMSEAGQAQYLIHHYESVLAQNDSCVNPKKGWMHFAMQDPALLHVTLEFSAWSLVNLQGRSSTKLMMYHKAESIRWLNKSLISNQVAKDSTITAVACLTLFETLMGNANGLKTCMDGMEALVNGRGGLQALPVYGYVRKMVTWADSEAAIVMDTHPRFELPSLENEERPEDWSLYSSLAMLYEARLFYLTGLQDLSKEIMEVYWGMRNLMGLKEAAVHLTRRVEFPSWSDMVERLKRRVVALLQSEVVKSGNPKLSIFVLFGHAAIIHMYMFMRDLPRGLPLYNLLSGRLRAKIEAVNLADLDKEYPEMILWILLLGGLGSTGTPNLGWYAGLLAQTCTASGLRGGNAIAYALAEFLWSELYRSPMTVGFWNGVAMAQGMENGYDVRKLTDHISVAVFNAPSNMLE